MVFAAVPAEKQFRFCLAHAVAVVFILELAVELEGTVGVKHSDGGVADTVEHVCLHGGVVNHVLEDDFFANL